MDSLGIIILIIIIISFIGAYFFFRFASRRIPPVIMLIMGVVLYVLGNIIGAPAIREAKLLGGIFQLYGFIGAILGLTGIFKKRKE